MKHYLNNNNVLITERDAEDICRKIKQLCFFYEGFSCAERTWRILFDVFDEDISKEFLRVGSINRGGALVGTRCGIVASAIMFLSYIGGRENPQESYEKLSSWVPRIEKTFTKSMGACECGTLWPEVERKIAQQELIPWTQCIIYEGIACISGDMFKAYTELKAMNPYLTTEMCGCPAEYEHSTHALRKPHNRQETTQLITTATDRLHDYLDQGFLCSEAGLRALLDIFGITWTEQEKRIATAFAFGSFTGYRCGIVEAAMLIVSYEYAQLDCRRNNETDRHLAQDLHNAMKAAFGSFLCADLRQTSACSGQTSCERIDDILAVVVSTLCNHTAVA